MTKEHEMSISFSSARRLAAGAVGASAVAGAMLFGTLPEANAAPMPAPIPAWHGHGGHFGGHHGHFGGHHGFRGHHGHFRGHHRGFGRGHHWGRGHGHHWGRGHGGFGRHGGIGGVTRVTRVTRWW